MTTTGTLQSNMERFCDLDIGMEISWSTYETVHRALTDILNKCLNRNGLLPASSLQYLFEYIDENAPFDHENKGDRKNREEGVSARWHCLLHVLIEHPAFATDPRYVVFLRKITRFPDFITFDPESCIYTTWTDTLDASDTWTLKEGFGTQHLPVFSRIIEEERFWQLTPSNNGEWLFLFRAIARALRVMHRQYPSETIPPRIRLLEQIAQAPKLNEMSRGISIDDLRGTFVMPIERTALEDLIKRDPYADVAHYARLLLDEKE